MQLPDKYYDNLEKHERIEWRNKVRFLGLTKKEWFRFWLHFPIGVLCGLLLIWFVTVYLGIILSIAFLVYEIMNDWRKGDKSYKDVVGFVWGLGCVGLVIFVIGVL